MTGAEGPSCYPQIVNFKSYAGRQETGPFHKVAYAMSL